MILYGRNDSYGYNLHKRAAISLNCMAEVLTHPGDEIIFVDCNTPDDMPTFPEAIQDTLTRRVKSLLFILRVRPGLYDKYKKDSPLMVLEPLSRNVAIRRSNPSNRWILSTNTDMVFVVRHPSKSLSDVVSEMPGGFYELPRFEVPEGLWESLDRSEPSENMEAFRNWGERLHLNEVILADPEIRYDGPGDFQCMLREQIFSIHGLHEEMVLGWHVDSNLCKRLHMLNGRTDSLLHHVFAYHCDHTRQSTFLHSPERTENYAVRYYKQVPSPFLQEQADIWGMAGEEIEEIRLGDEGRRRFGKALERLLPGMPEPTTTDVLSDRSYDHGQYYDTFHAFPYLSDALSNLSRHVVLGYTGANLRLLMMMCDFLSGFGHQGKVLVNEEFLEFGYPPVSGLPSQCIASALDRLVEESDLFIFDVGMMQFSPDENSSEIAIPAPSKEMVSFQMKMESSFMRCVNEEKARLWSAGGGPRKFLLVGSQHTWFEQVAWRHLAVVLTPYSTHVRQGYLKPEVKADLKPEQTRAPFQGIDGSLRNACVFLKRHMKRNESLLGPTDLGMVFPGLVHPYNAANLPNTTVEWMVIREDLPKEIQEDSLNRLRQSMRPVFGDDSCLVLTVREDVQGLALGSTRSPILEMWNGTSE